jgi:hypothetical protein
MFYTVHFMPHIISIPTTQDYAALRQTGTSLARATAELGLSAATARRFERVFRARAARGAGDPQLPKFARHDAHVAAVMAQGGFCAFSERRLPGGGTGVSLPLLWPEASGG